MAPFVAHSPAQIKRGTGSVVVGSGGQITLTPTSGQEADVVGPLDVSGHAAIGADALVDETTLISTPVDPWPAVLGLEERFADTSAGLVDGLRVFLESDDPADRFALEFFGVNSEVRHTSDGYGGTLMAFNARASKAGDGEAAKVQGCLFRADHDTGAGIGNIVGCEGDANHSADGPAGILAALIGRTAANDGSGDVTQQAALIGYNYVGAGTTATAVYGLFVNPLDNFGTVGNAYGLYLEDMNFGTGTVSGVRRAIHVQGNDESFFRGPILAAQGCANGQSLGVKALTELTTIAAAATTDTTIQIPQHAKVLAVSVRVVTAIPTAATFDVGVAGATTRFGTGLSTAANTTNPGTNDDGARYYGSAAAVRITPNATPAAATGQVRVTIHYLDSTPPTS